MVVLDKTDHAYLGLMAHYRIAAWMWQFHTQRQEEELVAYQNSVMRRLEKQLEILERLYRVRGRTPPDYDTYRECRGWVRPEVPEAPAPPPTAPVAPAISDLPMFKPKRGRRTK